ncbi:MAG: tRNA cyclic N6-threonylcarbamoyladenosine(37) synthase TcdA [Cellvibrio sp.]
MALAYKDLPPDYLSRFSGIARLYGETALVDLSQAHFAVIGLGGVGSWIAETLARSGVGTLTLIEMDDVCVTNTNRQSHALATTIGESKLKVIAERMKDINPQIQINAIEDFLDRDNLREYINTEMHVVIDAIDAAAVKAALVAYCSRIKVRLITIGSSGGKQDPTRIKAVDLGHTQNDPMLHKVRQLLFRHHKFSKEPNRKFRIDAVYSDEQMVYPQPSGEVCMTKQVLQDGVRLDCAGGFGSSLMVTGSFGFIAAHKAIERYLTKCQEMRAKARA